MSKSEPSHQTIQGYGHVFSRNPLDRGEKERRDESHIQQMTMGEHSRFLPLRNLDPLVNTSSTPHLHWLEKEQFEKYNLDKKAIFLGILDGKYHYTFQVSIDTLTDLEVRTLGSTLRFVDIRTCGQMLSREDAGIAGQARIQIYWHQQYRYCPVCGSETSMKRGGQVRSCNGCSKDHFPRTDPVIIVVVHDGDRCLLGQSSGRLQKTNTYSALAGFVDQGESIEEAVSREVMEEAGIEVKNVRYHSSQPWPMPYSLMIGCHAEATTTDINMDPEEMIDVKWFSREEVLSALNNDSQILKVPMEMAIAHHLVKSWAQGNLTS